jgi:hypothetical protein
MASRQNDMLNERTLDGTVNLYDSGLSRGTATEKGLAARMGGHTWNIITGSDKHEAYFAQVRNPRHPLFLGDQRRKVPVDPRGMVKTCLTAPDAHPRHVAMDQRRKEIQLAQTENSFSYKGFQDRCRQLFPDHPAKKYSLEDGRFCLETEKLGTRQAATKQEWAKRRGETMSHSISCPSLDLRNRAASLDHAMRQDPRKRVSQLLTESDHHAPRKTACFLANSKDLTAEGRHSAAQQSRLSAQRVENHDFSVTRQNNHFSGGDKLTKGDAYFAAPQHGRTTNSVKYDIVTNQRRWFKY